MAAGNPTHDSAMTRRLQDQMENFERAKTLKEKVAATHKVARDLHEVAFYPAHDKRTESPEYHKVHVKLTETLDLPCLVCGVKHSTLGNPDENPYGAKQMETHHHIIEWALANAIDPAKFNKTIRPHLAHRHPDKPEYAQEMTPEAIASWVDHSEDNLWVLCDVHHRAKHFGIHEISYPIWCPQDLLKPEFEEYVREQLKGASPAGDA